MKQSVKFFLILITIVTIAGCSDVEWFPDNRQPNPFYFATKTDVPLNSVVTSSSTFIGGNGYSTTITLTNGEMSLDGGKTWFGGSTTLPAGGSNVQVRHTSALTAQTSTVTTVTAGEVISSFTSVTKYNASIKNLAAVFNYVVFHNSTSVTVVPKVSSINFKITLPPSAYLKTNSSGGLDPSVAYISGLPSGTASLELLQYTAPTQASSASVIINLFSSDKNNPLQITTSTAGSVINNEIMTFNMLYPQGAIITTNGTTFSDIVFKNMSGKPIPNGIITFKNITSAQ